MYKLDVIYTDALQHLSRFPNSRVAFVSTGKKKLIAQMDEIRENGGEVLAYRIYDSTGICDSLEAENVTFREIPYAVVIW